MTAVLTVYSDGGARGNPGPAAIGFLVLSEKGEVIKTGSYCLGLRTNNQAEYEALIAALEFAVRSNSKEVHCYLDSELVVKHLTGEFRVKNPALRKLWNRVQELKNCFKKVSFKNVPRTNEFIRKVDKMVNDSLDVGV